MDARATQKQPWKSDPQRNFEYGDLRLRAMDYVLGAGNSMQTVSLRGHLLLDVAITQLLRAADPAGHPQRMPFWRKVQAATTCGLISTDIKLLVSDIAKIRNAHAHDLEIHYTFRQAHSLWVRAHEAGVEHRFFSNEEEKQTTESVAEMGELSDKLFNPADELADLCIELFTHIVFWNYDSFNLLDLQRILAGAK
jgi:hypothetical protein